MNMYELKIPKRSWIPLYSLYLLKNITTALKFQKLTFLIQVEGKLPGYTFFMHHYGPFSRELDVDSKFLNAINFVDKQIKEGEKYPYFVFSITNEGAKFVENTIEKTIEQPVLDKVMKIIKKHGNKNYLDITEYVYKKYVIPGMASQEIIPHLIEDSASLEHFWKRRYSEECPVSFLILAMIGYIEKAITKLSGIQDPVHKGVCIASISELTAKLIDLTSGCEIPEKCPLSFKHLLSDLSEHISFFDWYCSHHGILESVSDIDFSEFINEEELKRLQKIFQTTELIY